MNIQLLLVTLLVFSFNSLGYGQNVHSFMRPTGSLEDVKNGTFSTTEAGFSIDLPKWTGGFNGTKGMQYSWRLKEGYYFIGIEDREKEIENSDGFDDETGKVVDRMFNDMARDLFATKYEIKNVEKNPGKYQLHRSIDVRAVLTDSITIIRVFWVKNRAYKLGVLLTKSQLQFEPQALRVFESIKLASKESTDELVKKMVEENTPKPLPQFPVAQKAATDAVDDGLMGKVKAVFEETQFIKGEKAGSPRQKDNEDYYNELGNLTKSIDYDDTSGLPFQITVYGYINQKRVSRSGHVQYGNEIGGIIVGSPTGTVTRRDNRFDYRFAFKYDQSNRMVEKTRYDNAGKIWTRLVFKYTGDSVEEILYDEAGKVNMRSLKKLDEKKNPISTTYYNSPMDGWDSIYTYEYLEFDKEGNWLRQNMSKSRSFQGVVKEEWIMAKFRAISYYK